ncbi:hypothetical protein RIR_jg14359.t1 [Rhizophagus irregularis DAOM 181602=DAOM 197198]|nr:hypothetical protein RIR_jg14359.t1 [Rhizophagus irregularis DAOM 181602=DAOM 197198]
MNIMTYYDMSDICASFQTQGYSHHEKLILTDVLIKVTLTESDGLRNIYHCQLDMHMICHRRIQQLFWD